MELRATLTGCGEEVERSQSCEGMAFIHLPMQIKSTTLRTMQDGWPWDDSSSTQVAYIVMDPKSFKQEALDPLQVSGGHMVSFVHWPICGWLLRTLANQYAKFKLNPPIAEDFDQRTSYLVVGNWRHGMHTTYNTRLTCMCVNGVPRNKISSTK